LKTWIKNPLAVWTGTTNDATNGLVIDGDKIVEIVAVGREPSEKRIANLMRAVLS